MVWKFTSKSLRSKKAPKLPRSNAFRTVVLSHANPLNGSLSLGVEAAANDLTTTLFTIPGSRSRAADREASFRFDRLLAFEALAMELAMK